MTDSAKKSRLPRTGTLVLIALVLLIGGGALMVWLPYHRNQRAMAEIEKLGGMTESEIVRPFWIPDAIDDEYLSVFERIDSLNYPIPSQRCWLSTFKDDILNTLAR